MDSLKKIRFHEDEKYINLNLSDNSDGFLFRMILKELETTFKVRWKSQLDGFDQRYWDFEFNGISLTLHLEHYLGIIIFADKNKTDYEKARTTLREIEKHFKKWRPTN